MSLTLEALNVTHHFKYRERNKNKKKTGKSQKGKPKQDEHFRDGSWAILNVSRDCIIDGCVVVVTVDF